jgi:hypothetical protein
MRASRSLPPAFKFADLPLTVRNPPTPWVGPFDAPSKRKYLPLWYLRPTRAQALTVHSAPSRFLNRQTSPIAATVA